MAGDVSYTDEQKTVIFGAIMSRVSGGESLYRICREAQYPNRDTIYQWMADDPEKRKMYELAHDMRGEFLLEESLEIVDKVKTKSMVDVAKAKLQAEQRRFMLPKISRKYQDKGIQQNNYGPQFINLPGVNQDAI